MTWKPPAEKDAAVKAWMKAKGWEVNRRPEYDFDREVYAWRHELRGGASPTLRISQKVLEDYPPFAVVELLDRLNVAAAIRARPQARLVVLQKGSTVVFEELSQG